MWLNPDQLAKLLMCIVHGLISSSVSALVHKPEIGKCGRERGGYVSYRRIPNIRENVEEYRQCHQGIRSEEEVDDRHYVIAEFVCTPAFQVKVLSLMICPLLIALKKRSF